MSGGRDDASVCSKGNQEGGGGWLSDDNVGNIADQPKLASDMHLAPQIFSMAEVVL